MTRTLLFISSLLLLTTTVMGQQLGPIDCSPEALAQSQATFATLLNPDFEANPDAALANLFRLGALYQDMALTCGYTPDEVETSAMIARTLTVASLQEILAARAIGSNVDAALAEIEGLMGDSFTGQLLYNGIEPGLDGSGLGCVGCHNGETGPVTEGTWTRIVEQHLNEPELEGYTVERYLVESILQPNEYLTPGYVANLMPTNFGQRLDAQMLADLLAYLSSQDQEITDESP